VSIVHTPLHATYPARLGAAVNLVRDSRSSSRNLVRNRMISGTSSFRRRRSPQQLGGSGQQILTSAVPQGAAAGASYGATALLTAAGAGGAIIGTVVPVVGTIIGALIGGLLSGHFARAKGAKNENAALAQVLPSIIKDFQTVFAAASAGQISAQDAITAVNQIQQNFWQAMAPFESGPGQGGGPGKCGTGNPVTKSEQSDGYNTHCGTGCTAGCCVGCNFVNVWAAQAIAIFQAGGGTLSVKAIGTNKYGFPGTPGWSAKYTAPPATAALGPAAASAFSDLTAAGPGGLPLWMLLLGGYLAVKALA
jgi:hypothetical protein